MIQDGFHAALRRWLDGEIEVRANQIMHGFASDYADYKSRASYIMALTDVLAQCTELEKKLYGNPLKGAA